LLQALPQDLRSLALAGQPLEGSGGPTPCAHRQVSVVNGLALLSQSHIIGHLSRQAFLAQQIGWHV